MVSEVFRVWLATSTNGTVAQKDAVNSGDLDARDQVQVSEELAPRAVGDLEDTSPSLREMIVGANLDLEFTVLSPLEDVLFVEDSPDLLWFEVVASVIIECQGISHD